MTYLGKPKRNPYRRDPKATREDELAEDLNEFLHVAICDDHKNCPITLHVVGEDEGK